MNDLRDAVIRLAFENPELRDDLLPLLKSADEEESSSGKGIGGAMIEFLKEHGDRQVTNPDTKNKVKIKSLKGDKGKKLQQKLFQEWKEKKDKSKAQGRADAKKVMDQQHADSEAEIKRLVHKFKSKSPEQQERIYEKATGKKVKVKPSKGGKGDELKKLVHQFKGLDPKAQARVRKNLGL